MVAPVQPRCASSGGPSRLWLLFVLLLAVLAPSFASAQGAGTTQKLKAIRQIMEQGQELYIAQKYDEAAKVFEDGYSKHPYSAFLFNAGVCYSKLQEVDKALGAFNRYATVDPSAPDIENVRDRIRKLEASKAPPPVEDAGVAEAGATDAQVPPPPPTGPVDLGDDKDAMRSLVVVETEPEGAPLRLYRKVEPGAAAFQVGGANAGWAEVAAARSPANLTLAVGAYHVVIDKFRDFNVSETDIDVSAGRVMHFKANLSQGVFMSFLRVAAVDQVARHSIRGAYLYLDDREKKRAEWGTTPYGELVPAGEHEVLVEAPGYQPFLKKFALKNGEQMELNVELARVDYGIIRVKPRLTGEGGAAKIRIDEEPLGSWRFGEAAFEARVSAGRHRLTIEADGHKDYDGIIEVPKGQVLPIGVTMIPKYPRGAAWTQAVVGALFIGAGAYLGNESNRLHEELEADRARGVLEPEDDRITRGRIFAISANGGFAVGGVLAIIATYNFIKDPYPESSSRVDKSVEFDDPKRAGQVPSAAAAPGPAAAPAAPGPASLRRRQRVDTTARAPGLSVGPSVAPGGGGGLVIGGTF